MRRRRRRHSKRTPKAIELDQEVLKEEWTNYISALNEGTADCPTRFCYGIIPPPLLQPGDGKAAHNVAITIAGRIAGQDTRAESEGVTRRQGEDGEEY